MKFKTALFCKVKNPLVSFFLIILSVILGLIYWQGKNQENQFLPKSYQILQNLEFSGLYGYGDRTFKSVDGQKWTLSSLKGKVVILSFWATWCEPCVDEFPSLIKLLDVFPTKVVLLAVSQDEEEEDIIKFVKAFNGFRENLIVTMDKNKEWSQAFGVGRLPEGFIFDAQGKLLKKIIGIQNWSSAIALDFFENL